MSQGFQSLRYNTNFRSTVYDFQGLSFFHTWGKACYTRIAYDCHLLSVPRKSLFHLFVLGLLVVETETFVANTDCAVEADGGCTKGTGAGRIGIGWKTFEV